MVSSNILVVSNKYILIENIKKEPLSWYIVVIAAIIGITLVLMFTIVCYFIAANSDICYNKEKIRYTLYN